MLIILLVCFGLGYFVWLIDDWACGTLIKTRHAVGLPLAFLTELHGWYVPYIVYAKERLLIQIQVAYPHCYRRLRCCCTRGSCNYG